MVECSVYAQTIYRNGKALNEIYICHYIWPLCSLNPFKPQNDLLRTTSLFINMKREPGCSFQIFFSMPFFSLTNCEREWKKMPNSNQPCVANPQKKIENKIESWFCPLKFNNSAFSTAIYIWRNSIWKSKRNEKKKWKKGIDIIMKWKQILFSVISYRTPRRWWILKLLIAKVLYTHKRPHAHLAFC